MRIRILLFTLIGSAFHFDRIQKKKDPTFHSDADPDPTFQFDSDPDFTFQFDRDPDPTTNFSPDLDLPK